MEKVLLILESDLTQTLLSEALRDYEVRTCSAEDAGNVLEQFRPDALILDLFLPGTDGLTILENNRDLLPPVVLPITSLVTDYIQKKSALLGAGFAISKPCTIDYIVQRLKDMLLLQQLPDLVTDGELIDHFLTQFHLKAKPRVFSLLRTAILISVRDPDCLLTKDIYPVLCKEYGSSTDSVDQAIRRMLRSAWAHKEENSAVWEAVFPNCTQCPSNGNFITTAALYLGKKYPSRFRKGS